MILLKKAARSIWRGKKAYAACVVLMAVGISIYIAFNLLFVNLVAARDAFYKEQRLAEVFAEVTAIPLTQVQALAEIEGIAVADSALVADARVEELGDGRLSTLRLSSFDEAASLNGFLIVEGAMPADNEILIGVPYAQANGFAVGDALTLTIGGRRISFTVGGLVQSPEYVYAIPDAGSLFPDAAAFGYGYLSRRELASLTGNAGRSNRVSFLLGEGITYEDVRYQLEDALREFGLLRLYPRKDQASHAMLTQEIDSLGSMASSMPMIFILMAVIILYIMMRRVIEQERSQIGTLKAFGYRDSEVVLHYMGYGGITGLAGGALGVVLGLLMTGGITDMYLEFFHLPALVSSPDPVYIVAGLLIGLVSGLAGAYMGTRRVLRLRPSEAMRPPAPPILRHDIVGRLRFLRALCTSYGFMALRNITRNGFRSAFVVCGVAFSFSLIAFTASFSDMFDVLLFDQFTKVQLYDMKLTLESPQPYTAAVESVRSLGGVDTAEGLLEIPAELRLRHLRESVMLTAMERGSALYRIYDNIGAYTLPVPGGGVIVSSTLADSLGAKCGDTLRVQTAYTGDKELALPVLGIVNENLGKTVYMALDELCALLEAPRSVNNVILRTDDPDAIRTQLGDARNIAAMADQNQTLQVYEDYLATYSSMFLMMQLAGMAVAFAIITNTATISLSERSREYATMRVLGMHPSEIGEVISFEYWILTVAGILPGIPLTRLIKQAMAGMIDNDMFTIPLETSVASFVTAAVGCAITVALSNWSARRKISKFDMVEVLKERE